MENQEISQKQLILLILICSLGYFVDVYDLLLYGVIKIDSLKAMGKTPEEISGIIGTLPMIFQVSGLVIGGILWGKIGDNQGRIKALYGTIIIYSFANILNAFVESYSLYNICRVIAGIGLAGELGVGITLVKEHSKSKDINGPAIISGIGLLGAVLAGIIGKYGFSPAGDILIYFTGNTSKWQEAYLLGGMMGVALLVFRIFSVNESNLFESIPQNVNKGNFLMFFSNKDRRKRYLLSIGLGLPVYFVIALLIQQTNSLGILEGFISPLDPKKSTMSGATTTIVCYLAFATSDFITTIISNKIKSRKKVFKSLHIASFIMLFIFLYIPVNSEFLLYTKYALFGIVIGYWGLLTVNAAEQFGTNMRALASTSIPSFIRGAFTLIGFGFEGLRVYFPLKISILIIGLSMISIAIYSAYNMEDGYGKNLNIIEE